eukprot:c52938_g1_i1.p1 GENE.c52938_g1_i1~~c52938_g1_i1.p1  ORF type:complete len:158 (+),score=35.83 c52938_g1_i1:36-509(+)
MDYSKWDKLAAELSDSGGESVPQKNPPRSKKKKQTKNFEQPKKQMTPEEVEAIQAALAMNEQKYQQLNSQLENYKRSLSAISSDPQLFDSSKVWVTLAGGTFASFPKSKVVPKLEHDMSMISAELQQLSKLITNQQLQLNTSKNDSSAPHKPQPNKK